MRPMNTRPASLAGGMSTVSSPSRTSFSRTTACCSCLRVFPTRTRTSLGSKTLIQGDVEGLDHARPQRAIGRDELVDLGQALRPQRLEPGLVEGCTKHVIVQGAVQAGLDLL